MKSKSDLEAEELKGMVKAVKQSCFHAIKRNGEIVAGKPSEDTEEYTNRYYTFNEKGFRSYHRHEGYKGERPSEAFYNDIGKTTEIRSYKKDGAIDFRLTYIYDDKWNEIEQYSWNSEGKLRSKTINAYNEK